MKKWDKIIIIIALVTSFIPYFLLGQGINSKYTQTYVQVSVEGKDYMRMPLTGQVTKKEYLVQTEEGMNLIVIEGESVAVREADCPDGVCMAAGGISRPGELLVCLPNRVVVAVEGVAEEENEIDIYAY